MAKMTWPGAKERVGVLLITYKSGGLRQPVRSVREYDAVRLQQAIESSHELETKRKELRAAYAAIFGPNHAAIAQLDEIAQQNPPYAIVSWDVAPTQFDLPCITWGRVHRIFPKAIERVELVRLTTVIADN